MKDQKEKLQIILDACEDKKGIDTQVLEIGHLSSIGDYFVIVSGNSQVQVGALADEIDDKMAEAGFSKLNEEGKSSGRWIILDYGDIIVHVFHKEEREYYGLERLWQEPQKEE